MSVLAQQNILRLQVPVNYLLRVEVFDGEDYFCCVENYLLLVKTALFVQMVEEGAAALVIQQQVQVSLALEGVVKLENERVAQGHQDLALELDITEVVFLFEDSLIKDFHCVVLALALVLSLFNEKDLGEATFTEEADNSYRM